MSEFAPQPQLEPESYIEAHPDAIVDPKEALIRALASRNSEEEVVRMRKFALDAVSNPDYEDIPGRNSVDASIYYAGNAERSRELADAEAEHASDIYKRVKDL